jgi:hypothetical protein
MWQRSSQQIPSPFRLPKASSEPGSLHCAPSTEKVLECDAISVEEGQGPTIVSQTGDRTRCSVQRCEAFGIAAS